jgi:hypothetical protein
MKRDVRAEPQGLDEVVPIDRPELDVLQAVIPGELARDLIRDIEMASIVYVHAQFHHDMLPFKSCVMSLLSSVAMIPSLGVQGYGLPGTIYCRVEAPGVQFSRSALP